LFGTLISTVDLPQQADVPTTSLARAVRADFVAEVGEDVGVGGRDGFQVSVRPFSPHAPVGAAALTL
jgi:hypothetical protein